MKVIYIVSNVNDEPVMAFESQDDAITVGENTDGLSCVISQVMLMGGEDGMSDQRGTV